MKSPSSIKLLIRGTINRKKNRIIVVIVNAVIIK
jgi:hypothetical protein